MRWSGRSHGADTDRILGSLGLTADAIAGTNYEIDFTVAGTSVPLLNAAFRPAKGTGDLFVNATYFVTGAGGRRQPAVTIDGATSGAPPAASNANASMLYKPEPTPPKIISPSCISSIGIRPPSGVSESWALATAPVDAEVVATVKTPD